MKQCPFCHKSIEDDDIQCRYCDEWLDIIPSARKMKQCPFCRKKIESDEIQCRHCGEWLDIIEPPGKKKIKNGQASVKKQTRSDNLWDTYGNIISAIIVITVVVITYIVHQKASWEEGAKQTTKMVSPKMDMASTPTPASTQKSASLQESAPMEKPVSPRDRAEDFFKKALELCASGKCEDPPKVIEYLDEAIKLEPNFITAYNNRGLIYSELGNHQQAIEDYSKSINLKPNYAPAFYNRGCSYGRLGQYKQAVEDFNESIRLKPDDINSYHNRSISYLALRNKQLGCADAQKACDLGNCAALEGAKAKGICP